MARATQSRPLKAAFCRTLLLGVLGAGALVTPLLTSSPAEAAIVERVVAVVGPRAILLTDLRERALPFLLHIYNTIPEGPQRAANISQVFKVVLGQMVDEELEEVAAREAGIDVTETQVDQALAQTAAQNNITVNEVLAEAKRSGLTIQNYREELRRQLIQRTMVELRLRGRIRVSETDVRATYKRIATEERLQAPQRTLALIIPAGRSEAEKKKQATLAGELSKQAKRGADFRDLIAKNATLAGSGLRPPLPPLQENAAIQRATIALEVGDVSAPIRVDDTWMVIQVIERPPSQLPPYEQARSQMSERVYMEKIQAARKHWLDGLRRRTHVEIRL